LCPPPPHGVSTLRGSHPECRSSPAQVHASTPTSQSYLDGLI
jgi:hypothetical protein